MQRTAVLSLVATALVLGACGSGGRTTGSGPETIAGVAVTLQGGVPMPNTASACARRWNGSANAAGRAAAMRRAPKADAALVRRAGNTGYFRDVAGRCSIYVLTRPRSAVVFVETARGRFRFVADASGSFAANARLSPGGRLR